MCRHVDPNASTIRLVLRGQILKALELLYAHSERRAPAQTKRRIAKSTKKNIWLKVEVLLKQTPVFGVNIDSMVEFETRWERWQADCRYQTNKTASSS